MQGKSRRKTVLVVEDEAEVCTFASRVLELEGYHVLRAGTGEAGLELLTKNTVSLTLLDLSLPGIDGWMVMETIKTSPKLSKIPVILFSASVDSFKQEKALSSGAAAYLVKPVSAAQLRETVQKIIGKG